MTLSVGLDPRVTALLTAIGLTDSDGRVVAAWFDDPLAGVSRVLSDPVQRAALLRLLDEALPPGGDLPGWHPLLDEDTGNLYVTVDGDVVGVAAALTADPADDIRVRGSIAVPLVDTAGALRAVAGGPDGPIRMGFDLELTAPDAPLAGAGADVTIDVEQGVGVVLRLRGVDLGAGPVDLEVDSSRFGADLVAAVRVLLDAALDALSADGGLPGRLAAHLFALLGLTDGAIPPLPLDRLLDDPRAVLDWLTGIVGTPGTLLEWGTHLAGLIGADRGVTGAATPEEPLSAPLLEVGPVTLDLLVAPTADGQRLELGLAVTADAGVAELEASATLFAIPLLGNGSTEVVPHVAVLLTARGAGTLLPAAPAAQIGTLRAGFRLDAGQVKPWLELTRVILDGVPRGTVDLTDADAVAGVVAGTIDQLLEDAFGPGNAAEALLSLIGLRPPSTDPTSLNRTDVLALGRGPTRALGEFHRTVLADHDHPWSHLLGELARLLGLTGDTDGTGVPGDPWRVEIATAGPVVLSLAAWNARDAATPDGEQRLRLGLVAQADVAPFRTRWLAEALAVDLPEAGAGAVALVGRQELELSAGPLGPVRTPAGLTASADRVRAVAGWRPGEPLRGTLSVSGLRVTAKPDGDDLGPVTWTFPATDADPGPGADALALVRLLLREALQAWGGEAAYVGGALLGLHRGLPGLPRDWPLLGAPGANGGGDLAGLFADPAASVRDHLRRLATGASADGTPFVEHAAGLLRTLAGRLVPDGDPLVPGSGTYDDPWSLPLAEAGPDGGGRAELIAWLDPDGPPTSWAGALAGASGRVADGVGLAALLERAGPFHPALAGLLRGRTALAAGLDELRGVLEDGDGVVPLASQLPAGWTHGAEVASTHVALPRHPDAIAQVVAQLGGWGGPVLLVAPAFADHTCWDDLLAVLEPGRPAGAHLDLRALPDPAEVDLGRVAGTARCWTADLLAGAASPETDQLERAVRRVAELTRAAKVALVAHSTAGVTARVLAAARPELVRGVVTLATPHAGSPLTPLTAPLAASALRVAAGVAGQVADTAAGATVLQLAAVLDGVAGPLGTLGPPGAEGIPAGFAGVPEGLVDAVPRLAIGATLGGDVAGLLADAVARLPVPGAAPTHAAVGLRVSLPFPVPGPGAIAVAAGLRVDLGRVRLLPGAAEPARPARAAALELAVDRPGGWLLGGDALDPLGSRGPRLRRLEAGVLIRPGADGAVDPSAWLRLVEAGTGATASAVLGLADDNLAPVLDALLAQLGLAADDAPARRLLELLQAAGLVVDTADGLRTSVAGVAELAGTPLRTLTARGGDLLGALRSAIDAPPGGAVMLPAGLAVEPSFDPATATLRLRTTADLALAGPFSVRLDLALGTRDLAVSAAAALMAGPVTLGCDTAGTVRLEAAPWVEGLVLRPCDPATLGRELGDHAAGIALSAAATALLGDRAPASIGPVHALLRDPAGWLLRPDAFGAAGGGIDGDKVNALLKAAAGALGLDATAGLGLPGGYLLSAAGSGPARFTLSGTFGSPAAAALGLDVTVEVHADGHVSPAGAVTATVGLLGDWGPIEVRFTLAESGPGLVVTPGNVAPIRLLPTVDGLGALITGATSLLPRLLQELVTRVRAEPGPHDVLDAVLEVATALGVYAGDAAGFEEPAASAQLRAMLEPGWLESQVADPATVAGLLADLFDALTLPAGHRISRIEDRLRWELPVPGGATVAVELGWGADGTPQAIAEVAGLDTGPVTVVLARLGFLAGLTGDLTLRLDPGDELAFLTPEVALGVDDGRFSARILPIGETRSADAEVVIVPEPRVTFTVDGAVGMAGAWLLPLVTRYLLPLVEDLLDEEFWPGGPDARRVLSGADLIPAAAPASLLLPLPDLPELAMKVLTSLLSTVSITIPGNDGDQVSLAVVTENGRTGLRVVGQVTIPAGDVEVSVRLGAAPWLTDPDAGITVWVLRDAPGASPPFAIEPALDVAGLGAAIGGTSPDDPLVRGPVSIGGIGALAFFRVTFLEADAFVVRVRGLGGALEIAGAQVNLDSGDGDSIVAKVLPKELRAPFSLAIAYRDDEVQLFGGVGGKAGGIELTFPLDLDLFHVLFLRELFLAAHVHDGTTDAIAAISGNASLGPLAVAVTRAGLRVVVERSGARLSFKPPDGFGLSLDTSVVRAGGFLLVDAERGRYVGAVEISVLKKFDLTAIGIITTKRPDGSPGFSLLFLVTVKLPVPIPIGYGFFFAGAGGLLGLERGVDLDRLRDGLRAGTADSILFPTDVVRRIDTIVRDLEESFPQAPGHFLVGPMVAIQWMNPPLVTVKVGLIVEIANPPRIAILGVLRLALPDPDAAVVDLKVAFLGSIDLGAALLSFDASIYDSFIGYGDFRLSLEGDIAVRVSWGPSPDVVTSVGGFHPSYVPAAHLKLPAMRRLTLSLLKDNPRITLRLYFAVTSNTVQAGAQLELFVGVAGFSIAGELGFDVLVQFVPFLLDAHMWARLAVRAGSLDICSISLDLQLRGPTPWTARGKARFSILFISVTVEVEAGFGEARDTSLAAEPILDRLLGVLRDPRAWAAELSRLATASVTVVPPAPGELVVDAAGLLSVTQSLIPLATDIGLVGAVPPADIRRAAITEVRFGTEQVPHDDVLAGYAPSTFASPPAADADRLRAPAFEQRPTGVRLSSGETLAAGPVVGHAVAYERFVLDDPDAPPARDPEPVIPPVAFGRLVAGGAVGSSAGSRRRRDEAERGSLLAALQDDPLFAVTELGDLRALGDDGLPVPFDGTRYQGPALLPRTDADARLAVLEAAGGGRYHVVPEVQVAR